jgi:hypothetical protein
VRKEKVTRKQQKKEEIINWSHFKKKKQILVLTGSIR